MGLEKKRKLQNKKVVIGDDNGSEKEIHKKMYRDSENQY